MPRYVPKFHPVIADQWFKNGDHPEDRIGEIIHGPDGVDYKRFEGKIVRFFRHPNIDGAVHCRRCGLDWDRHGWIERGEFTVCPGDYILTTIYGYKSANRLSFERMYRREL